MPDKRKMLKSLTEPAIVPFNRLCSLRESQDSPCGCEFGAPRPGEFTNPTNSAKPRHQLGKLEPTRTSNAFAVLEAEVEDVHDLDALELARGIQLPDERCIVGDECGSTEYEMIRESEFPPVAKKINDKKKKMSRMQRPKIQRKQRKQKMSPFVEECNVATGAEAGVDGGITLATERQILDSARHKYAAFYDIPEDTVVESDIVSSSAGIYGWAFAQVEVSGASAIFEREDSPSESRSASEHPRATPTQNSASTTPVDTTLHDTPTRIEDKFVDEDHTPQSHDDQSCMIGQALVEAFRDSEGMIATDVMKGVRGAMAQMDPSVHNPAVEPPPAASFARRFRRGRARYMPDTKCEEEACECSAPTCESGPDGSIRASRPNADDGSLPRSKSQDAKKGTGAEPKPTTSVESALLMPALKMFLERGEALMSAQIGWEKLTLLVDSGASDTVVPLDVCTAAPIHKTGKVGVEYEIANGGYLENLGERRCVLKTSMDQPDSAAMMMSFQVVDVSKALLSVAKVCEQGHAVIFEKTRGAILVGGDPTKRIEFRKVGNTYELDVWVKPGEGFVRQV